MLLGDILWGRGGEGDFVSMQYEELLVQLRSNISEGGGDGLHENEPRRCTPGIRGGIVVEQMIFMAKLTQWLVDC